MLKVIISLILCMVVMLVGCASPSNPTPVSAPAKTVVVTQPAPPAPQVILPPEFPDALKRISVVEGELLMLKSSINTIGQNVPATIKSMQSQIGAYAPYKYEMEAIRAKQSEILANQVSILARLSVIETKLGITP